MTMDRCSPIAVFDSGMGGISVLRELRRYMPNENYLFFGDSKNAPYGVRPVDEVRRLTIQAAEQFVERGAKAIVIACNTATSAAIVPLRQRWPQLPIIGLEPALKPAVLHCQGGRVLVMATPLTLREHKFAELMEHYQAQAQVLRQPAAELVEFVESGELDSTALAGYLDDLLAPYQIHRVDGVVLGCTHFPFVRPQIARALGYPVQFFDGGEGAARETRRLLDRAGLRNPCGERGRIVFESSEAGRHRLEICRRLLELG